MIHKILGKYVFRIVISLAVTISLVFANGIDNTQARRYSFDMQNFLDGNFNSDKEEAHIANSPLDLALGTESVDVTSEYGQYKFQLSGSASHYAHKFHGRMTANGEIFNMNDYTCANKSLPFGTIMRITNLKNGKKVLVRVNDRGPYVGDRIIDLSLKAAKEIDDLGIPKIKAEGFNRKNFTRGTAVEQEYFIGYSFDKEIICIPSSQVHISYETKSFSDAVERYKLLTKDTDIKNAYLFVSGNYSRKVKDVYIIGSVKKEPMLASK